ncbi:Putative pectinesterase 63 [Apostasia shenzhenica]|uniref:Pectinesterase n=1 Tax=Apostasia shenzhenica TaxID=1088818 RepID=A0A2I0B058_9ASPA|nr:Putative pectinesterase 63 [Apostasia shenzhenica]
MAAAPPTPQPPPAAAAVAAAVLFLLPSLLSASPGDLLLPSTSTSTLERWISNNLEDYHLQAAGNIPGDLDPKLLQAELNPRVITVRQDGKGDFRTVSGAIASIPAGNQRRTVIRIGPGVYKEKVKLDLTKPYVTFSGDANAMPTITFGGRAAQYGTLDSATVIVESNYFIASNIIFHNSAKRPVLGEEGAQAVAMRISGDKAAFYGCRFLGYQDTLCDDKGKHLFKDCFIQGTVDFIFGNGRSIYLRCEINSVADGITYITAQARSMVAEDGGFAFVHCKVTGTGNAYLSRAWKDSSRVVFAYTFMGSLVQPKGWDDKGFPNRRGSVFYGEYKCMGPGAATGERVDYVKLLTDEQVKPFVSMTFIRPNTWLLPQPKL